MKILINGYPLLTLDDRDCALSWRCLINRDMLAPAINSKTGQDVKNRHRAISNTMPIIHQIHEVKNL